jgi:hypothetical protein
MQRTLSRSIGDYKGGIGPLICMGLKFSKASKADYIPDLKLQLVIRLIFCEMHVLCRGFRADCGDVTVAESVKYEPFDKACFACCSLAYNTYLLHQDLLFPQIHSPRGFSNKSSWISYKCWHSIIEINVSPIGLPGFNDRPYLHYIMSMKPVFTIIMAKID